LSYCLLFVAICYDQLKCVCSLVVWRLFRCVRNVVCT